MMITNKITLDLQKPGTAPTIHAVQNDSYSRNLEIALFSDHRIFAFPENTAVVIRYKKSDGKGGEYDTLPDGNIAWWANRNILTVALAPQVLTTPGSVLLTVSLITDGTQLTLFPIRISVEPVAAAKLAKSEDYFYVTGLLPAPVSGKVGQHLRIAAVNDKGRITAVEAADRESLVQEVLNAWGDPTVYGLPVLYLIGDTTGMSKDNAVSLDYVYGERSGSCTLKWQGSSSLSYPKKNYTIKFDNAFEAAAGWGEQKKYCLKANYIDHSHARNVVSAKLWGELVKSRNYTQQSFKTDNLSPVYAGNGQDKSLYFTVTDSVITATQSATNQGTILFTGNTYEAGKYIVSLEAYNPNSTETDAKQNIRFACGKVGTENTDYFYETVATPYGEWTTITKEIEFSEDGGMIGFIGNTGGNYKFRNISIVPVGSSSLSNLKDLVNGGAVDGFPVCVYLNGQYTGLYTFNIPKDGWMFGMNDSSIQQAILCADTQNEACGFKALATLTEDFDLEYVSDEENADWVLTSLNTLIAAVMNSDGTDLDSNVAKYLDWQSAIDYMIFTVLLGGHDMYRKNYLLVTYDGVKWFFSAYDMDSTFGLHWSGEKFLSMSAYPSLNGYNHRIMELIYAYKKDELLTRYKEIRNTVMSEDNVYQKFTNFASAIPSPVFVEDVKLWPTIPSSSASNTAQILNWYRLRSAFIDKQSEQM